MLALVGSGCVGCAQASAGEKPLIRIGTSGDYPPFSEAIDEHPGYRGFDIAVADAFAGDRGYQIAWVRFRWPLLAEGLSTNRFDLAMSGVTVRSDRSALGRFSVPVMNSGAVLLVRVEAGDAGTGLSGSTLEYTIEELDRKDFRIAVNRGGHLERVARATFKHAHVRGIPDNTQVREALAKREVDAVVTDTLEAPVWREGLDGVVEVGPLTRDRKAYWIAPGRTALARELDAWLIAREADGTLARLRQRHVGGDALVPTAEPGAALLAAIDERLAMMPWVAESKRASGRAIEDVAQEKRVLAAAVRDVDAAAKRVGVGPPPEVAVRTFYRAQIEAAKAIQRRVLAAAPTFDAQASDLGDVLRPALMRIGDRMAQLVVELHRARVADETSTTDALDIGSELSSHGLERERLDDIERSIEALRTQG